MKASLFVVLFATLFNCWADSITTIAGAGWIFPQDLTDPRHAPFGIVETLKSDNQGNIVFADRGNHKVFRLKKTKTFDVIAGNGIPGYSGDGGPARFASLNGPAAAVIDSDGSVFIADGLNHVIRKVSPDGTITTFAGNTAITFLDPVKLAVDAGNVYLTDYNQRQIKKIEKSTGRITTLAGTGAIGDCSAGVSVDGLPATSVALSNPTDLIVDVNGVVYFADSGCLNGVYRIQGGQLQLVAGKMIPKGQSNSGTAGDGVPAKGAHISGPSGLAFAPNGDLYLSNTFDAQVRRVSNDKIYTVAGDWPPALSGDSTSIADVRFNKPSGLTFDPDGDLFIADTGNLRILEVFASFKTAAWVAGDRSFRTINDGTPPPSASLWGPTRLALDPVSGAAWITDTKGGRLLQIANNTIRVVTATRPGATGDQCGGDVFRAGFPTGIAIDLSGNIFVADYAQDVIYKLTPRGDTTYTFTVLAGSCERGFADAPGPGAKFNVPMGLVLGTGANANFLFVADSGNNAIRRVNVNTGAVDTYAGAADAKPTFTLSLNRPHGLAFDPTGQMVIADRFNARVVRLDASGHSTVLADATNGGLSGPWDLAIDSRGITYIADSDNNRILRYDGAGIVPVAGTGSAGFGGDGGPPQDATLSYPTGVTIGPQGDLYVVDQGNDRIRLITGRSGVIEADPSPLPMTVTAGGAEGAAQITVQGTPIGQPITVRAESDCNCLRVGPLSSSVAPATIDVFANPANLHAGDTPTGKIRIISPVSPEVDVPVVFTILTPDPASLAVDSGPITDTFAGDRTPHRLSVRVRNLGGQTLKASVSVPGTDAFLRVLPNELNVSAAKPEFLEVMIDPGVLAPGVYKSAITIDSDAGRAIIPVAVGISPGAKSLRLLQHGLLFPVYPGAVAQPLRFLIANDGRDSFNWTAALKPALPSAPQPSWLKFVPDHGTAKPNAPSIVTVTVDAGGLAPGDYFSDIEISAPDVPNAPQIMPVTLHVIRPGDDPGLIVSPPVLVFRTTVGSNPSAQIVNAFSPLASTDQKYQSSATSADGRIFFRHEPSSANINPGAAITVQPDAAQLPAGVYEGAITLVVKDLPPRVVRVILLVSDNNELTVATAESASTARGYATPRASASSCDASKLNGPLLLYPAPGFRPLAASTVPIIVFASDQCGHPVNGIDVNAAFSNGDLLQHLASAGDGQYIGEWQLRNASAAGVTLTIEARISADSSASTQVNMSQPSNQPFPSVDADGIKRQVTGDQAPFSVGDLLTVKGTYLALGSGPFESATVPWPRTLAGTSMKITGQPIAVSSVQPNKIEAMLPFSLADGYHHQIAVTTGIGYTIVSDIILAAYVPAVVSRTVESRQYALIHAVDSSGSLSAVDAGTPVAPGSRIAIDCAGLGAVDSTLGPGEAPDAPVIQTLATLTATLAGRPLALVPDRPAIVPQAPGQYRLYVTIPDDLPDGDADLSIRIGEVAGPPVLLRIGTSTPQAAFRTTPESSAEPASRVPQTGGSSAAPGQARARRIEQDRN